MRICGTLLRNQRVVIFGAGIAGIGIADQIRDVMVAEGLSPTEATRRFWCVDRQGCSPTTWATGCAIIRQPMRAQPPR